MTLVVVAALKATSCASVVQRQDSKICHNPSDGQRSIVEMRTPNSAKIISDKTFNRNRTSVNASNSDFDGHYITVRLGSESLDALIDTCFCLSFLLFQ